MPKLAKRVKANNGLVEKGKVYSVQEAIELAKKTANTKFVGSLEVHIRAGIDPKQTDQNIRGTASLPHGTGKLKRVAAFVSDSKEKEAKDAGVTLVGGEDLIKTIKETEKVDFDVAIAEPAMMPKLALIAKILGPKGVMPNPKTGTVTKEVAKVVEEFKKGKVEFRLDKDAIIHMGFGKISLKQDGLMSNFTALFKALSHARPASAKGTYLQKVVLASTMGPGIRVDLSSLA